MKSAKTTINHRTIGFALVMLAMTSVILGTLSPAFAARARYNRHRVIIKVRDSPASVGAAAAMMTPYGAESVEPLFPSNGARSSTSGNAGWFVMKFRRALSMRRAMKAMSGDPAIELVEHDYRVRATRIPNDPLFPLEWGLDNTGQTDGSPDADVDAVEAWDTFTGTAEVAVAVVDSGVDIVHPDLGANIWSNTGEIPGNGRDDDRNGYVDDVHGWDFVNNDGDPMDDYFHGTHVAGTIAAVGNNGIGVAGVSWNARIMPVKVLGSFGAGWTTDVIRGVVYAVDAGAKVINLSLGGGGYSEAFRAALVFARDRGVLVVAAAGNSAHDIDLCPEFPAGYDVANMISVAATTHDDLLAYFSNYGLTSVDLGAPGMGIVSTLPNGEFGSSSGTSMAAPHVAGAAALLWSLSPDLSVDEVKAALLDSVDFVPSLAGITLTGGRLNVDRAIQSLGPVSLDDGDVGVRFSSGSGYSNGRRAHDWFCVENQICETGDANGDGFDDLIGFSRGAPGFVWVGLGRGDGSFEDGRLWATGFCRNDEVCKLGDLNGDGRADVISFVRSSAANAGDVFFALSSGTAFDLSTGLSHEWFCVADQICDVADANGDGRADLIGFSRGDPGFVWVGLSRGDGTIEDGRLWATGFCRHNEVCRLGDLNGDGRADLLAFVRSSAPNAGDVYFALSSGTAFNLSAGLAHDWFCVENQICDVADTNGDGYADLIGFSRGAPGFVWVGLGQGNGTFQDGTLWIRSFCIENEVCRTADIDGDGMKDLVAFHRMNTPE